MSSDEHAHSNLGRRELLHKALVGTVAGIATHAGIQFTSPNAIRAQTALSPTAALQTLLEGNTRFASNQLTSIEHDLIMLKQHTVHKQEPFAAVLSCADSRVPVELIFDQTIGHIFVTRIAGNIVAPEVIASLEYGVVALGIKILLVLGHRNCGAVKAAMHADAAPGQISALYRHLQPAVERSRGEFDAAIETNALLQAELLRTSSTVIRAATQAGQVSVEAAVYDLATGKVRLM